MAFIYAPQPRPLKPLLPHIWAFTIFSLGFIPLLCFIRCVVIPSLFSLQNRRLVADQNIVLSQSSMVELIETLLSTGWRCVMSEMEKNCTWFLGSIHHLGRFDAAHGAGSEGRSAPHYRAKLTQLRLFAFALPYDGTTDEGKKGLLGLVSFIASLFPKGE